MNTFNIIHIGLTFEYCGGESLFDGCQCCTSLDWAEDPSKVNAPICKRGDDFMKMLA